MFYDSRRSRLRRAVWTAGLLGIVLATAAQAANKVLKDEWMAMYMGAQKMGYAHTRTVEQKTDDGALYVTEVEEHMVLARGAVQMAVGASQRVVEGEDGRVREFEQEMDLGGNIMAVRGRVKDGKLVITMGEGPNAQQQAVEVPDGLCPWAVEKATLAKGLAPGTMFELPIFLAQAPGRACTATAAVGEMEEVSVFEIKKWLHRVEVEVSAYPGLKVVTWVDKDGQAWLSRTSMGGIQIELRRVSKELALSPNTAAELMVSFAIRPDRPIVRPRERESLTLLLKPTADAAKNRTLPEDPLQSVKPHKDGLLVTVRKAKGDPKKSYSLPYKGKEWAGLLRPTAWLESEDPLIVGMSKAAVGGEGDALEAAYRIEQYVRKVMTNKGLGVGFATALETARQKAGDCTEHAVLTTALARAAGIPSRLVVGMAYTEAFVGGVRNSFLYHMWTEVYVGEWLPIDAAMGAHDATHVALGRSNLDSPGAMLEISAIMPAFLGSTEISVLESRE
ncbi:MAG: transglutaminase-like domain-containing protein [Candidatus Brocadiia bacterium]|jgi:hypothetical protein|nr:transglutaminase-like domain-containing protein [Candidatus Brocadiia bacterium]